MKKLFLSLGLLLWATVAQAQCVAVGGINSVPVPGLNCLSEPTVASFMAAGYGIVPASSATDIACLTGNATTVTRLQAVRVTGTAGTLVTLPVLLNKHTVANTGGTAATTTALPTPVKMDSSLAAASSTTTAYTANPTVDSTAAILDVKTASFNVTSALVNDSQAFFDYKNHPYWGVPVLRGVAQQICVNLGGISVSSGLLAVSFSWTEAAQ